MQFNVSMLLREPVGSIREYNIDDAVVLDGDQHRFTGRVTFIRTNGGVLARVAVTSTARYECSRCLAPLKGRQQLEYEEEYVPTVDPVTGATLREEREPDAFTIDQRHMLDLEESIRQYWFMVEPMQPLCRPDCAGLCPVCGKNKNMESCACQDTNSRWSALADLQSALDKE